jgi:two-component system chemotaxis response regulator CheB
MKKNILLIDDSALMRRVLTDIINADDRFQVIELAVNGLDGLNILLDRGKIFDAVLLDINMPKMNGLEMLEELKRQKIKAKVIIVSTIATKEAKETIRALELGAYDFVTKPESYLDIQNNTFADRILNCLAEATSSEIRNNEDNILKRIETVNPSERSIGKAEAVKASQSSGKLVAIACSTGGPKALHTVIPKLPEKLDASVIVVQHMPGGFTKSLADRLNELSQVTVKEAEDGEQLVKGTVYIAKGGNQMRVKKRADGRYAISIASEPARNGLLPCADIMYESLLYTDYDQITCVVLTGMGADGTAGITQLYKNKNIYVIAQNEETSIVYGMPKVVKDAGLVDEITALDDISDAIIKNVGVQ